MGKVSEALGKPLPMLSARTSLFRLIDGKSALAFVVTPFSPIGSTSGRWVGRATVIQIRQPCRWSSESGGWNRIDPIELEFGIALPFERTRYSEVGPYLIATCTSSKSFSLSGIFAYGRWV